MSLTTGNRKLVLAERPGGTPVPECFRVEEEEIAALQEGSVRIEVDHLSIDAFIRTTLEEKSYHQPVPIGGTITALGVGRVVESCFPGLQIGEGVFGPLGVQTVATLPGFLAQKIDEKRAPLRAYLGILGLTSGITAYVGMRKVGLVKAGETVVVSGAAGAVGSMASQIAKLDGGRVIGIAGGAHKVRYLVEDLGLDSAIDYKHEDVAERLRELAPEGVDVFFDNVGGTLLDLVLEQIRLRARVVICGAISQYQGNVQQGVAGPRRYLRLAEQQARMEGFAVTHFPECFGEATAALARWRDAGDIKLNEHVIEGVENFFAAMETLFGGGHIGKLMLKP